MRWYGGAAGPLGIEIGLETPHDFQLTHLLALPSQPAPHRRSSSPPNRPDLYLATLALKSATAGSELARAKKWGDLSLSVFFEEEASIDEPNGKSADRMFGLGFSLPLPLRDKRQGEIQANLARQSRAQAAFHALNARIQAEIEIAEHAVREHHQLAIDYAENVLTLAEQNVRLTQEAYYNGQLGLTEVLRAQESRVALEHDFVEMLKDYYLAVAELQHAR